MHDGAKSRITVEELFSVLKNSVFRRLLIPKITHPKSTSAKPAGSTANVDVANGAASRIHKSQVLPFFLYYCVRSLPSQGTSADR